MFTITPQVRNGTSEKLTKRRSYHDTTLTTNDQLAEYIAKAKGQDKEVLAELKINQGTPREIFARMNAQGKAILLTSVRRSLPERQAARGRYRSYKDGGYTLSAHDLAQRSGE